MDHPSGGRKHNKLGLVSGVYIPVCLNIFSILLFLRFGLILGQIGLVGMLGLLLASYSINVITTLSLSAVSSNGEVRSGGTYYLISRSLGPEFGGSIGLLFYLAQALNTALNIVGLIAVLKSNFEQSLPHGYWWTYLLETCALIAVTALSLAGSGMFSKASNALLIILSAAILSIPFSAIFRQPFVDPNLDVNFTGMSLETLNANLWPHTEGAHYDGISVFRDLFGILFPATSGIFAGASMSGDLKAPSKSIPAGTLWAILTTFIAYLLVIISLAASTSHGSLLRNPHIIQDVNLYAPTVLAGELAVTFFSALMGILAAAKLMQALARDKLFPGSSFFGKGLKKTDEPFAAVLLTYGIAQLALLANLDQLASLIAIFYMLTFFTMNLACFLLRISSAPNFRPGFKFFSWQSAFIGAVLSAAAMFFIDGTAAATAVCLLIFLFLLLHYFSPPKHWGDISQSLIYHQVRKYLLRIKPEHIKFWRPQIILLVNDPRHQTPLIQFCNSMKKGALYILGHVIVTSDFNTGVQEAKSQQQAWTKYISEFSKIKAFVQLNMSPSITWGVRNLILAAGLGGMRPNIAVIGFYNLPELRQANPHLSGSTHLTSPGYSRASSIKESKTPRRRRGDTSARLLEGHLPTDVIRTEGLMSASDYLTILEDLALRFRMNVAIGKGFHNLEAPRHDGSNRKKYIDLWPIQMSAELQAEGKSVLTTNFDTYTLILQLGCILHSVQAWAKAYRLRVLVFVEYAQEVESERGRVKMLLEKLRIEADVLVFYLASGNLATYETIVAGRAFDSDTDAMVNDCLKEEDWWTELQTLRGRPKYMSASQELDSLANVVESTAGRPGVFNPHNDHEAYGERRRHSLARVSEFPKKPTVSTLARLGVNMGIHTANLLPNVFDSSSEDHSGSSSEIDTDASDDDGNADFNDDASAASEGDLEHLEPVRRPLLSSPGRRKSYNDVQFGQILEPLVRRNQVQVDKISRSPSATTRATTSYGTMSPAFLNIMDEEEPTAASSDDPYRPNLAAVSSALLDMDRPATPRRGLSRNASRDQVYPKMHTPKPMRPAFSRQSTHQGVRFSSQVLPQTEITEQEGEAGPVLGFAESDEQLDRPAISRTTSQLRFSSRVPSDTKIYQGDLAGPSVLSAPLCETRPWTEPPSPGDAAAHVSINIPDLLATYEFQAVLEDEEAQDDAAAAAAAASASNEVNSSLPLSFNDLPSRAQYLILNELLRQNSSESAVLYTTLPIPTEGTCKSEETSVQYLSDIEVLCNDLPPVLLVLSNNMTVTVSL
ncbi:solute carrier family 12 member 3 [Coniella lustricola]|uniref:Solute carrier family 12 member 3 n=1 Tax=Coniella lustricola TaxID=2025994 RepID=A0A2T3AC68_9PEZI|nr:solute carrier family 12 member 3 [Coniella lustricola]